MKQTFLLAFIFLLTACTTTQPQVTVTREVTVTLPPTLTATPTLAPTATPTTTPIPTYSPETWETMTPDQKLAAVPASPEYTVGNVSTIEGKDNYVIVRDPQTGEATGAWNAFTGKVETMSDAGIKIFKLTDGSELELRSFKTVEAYREYLMNNPNLLWMTGDVNARMQATANFWTGSTKNPETMAIWDKMHKITNWTDRRALGGYIDGDGTHVGQGEFTPIYRYGLNGGTFVASKDANKKDQIDYVEAEFQDVVNSLQ